MRDSARLILKHSTAYPFQVTPNEHLQCYFCPHDCADPVEFRKHVDLVHSDVDKSTALCDTVSTRIDITYLTCKICDTAHDTLISLADHLNIQHDLNVDPNIKLNLLPLKLELGWVLCGACGERRTSHKDMSKHLYMHSLGLICSVCDKQFKNKRGLRVHTAEKHSSNIVCRRCKFPCLTTEERIKHVRDNKACWPFVCAICRERFNYWEMRQVHLEQVHGQEKMTFECKECGLVFEKRIKLYYHHKKVHTQDLMCHVCDKRFSTKKELLEHGFTHTGERPYKCPYCEATFAKTRIYETHLRIHTDRKKIPCPGCGRLFLDRTKIKKHVNKYHPEIFKQWAVSMNYRM